MSQTLGNWEETPEASNILRRYFEVKEREARVRQEVEENRIWEIAERHIPTHLPNPHLLQPQLTIPTYWGTIPGPSGVPHSSIHTSPIILAPRASLLGPQVQIPNPYHPPTTTSISWDRRDPYHTPITPISPPSTQDGLPYYPHPPNHPWEFPKPNLCQYALRATSWLLATIMGHAAEATAFQSNFLTFQDFPERCWTPRNSKGGYLGI